MAMPRLLRRDGDDAHAQVSSTHWCVSRADLVKLRRAVEEQVARSLIVPTDKDPFDPSDNKYGPSVHTVVAQMIKPISALAGGSSWALIQHPDGLKCDLFITHGWVEGIYEFIDKVLNSWPATAKGAYCCMLSNPQTLDVGRLVAHPIYSPFAQALACAEYVLVVPNRRESLYQRSWCAYEAYLAWKWNRTLTVATLPIHGRTKLAVAFIVCCCLSALVHIAAILWFQLDEEGGQTRSKGGHGYSLETWPSLLRDIFRNENLAANICMYIVVGLHDGRCSVVASFVGVFFLTGREVCWIFGHRAFAPPNVVGCISAGAAFMIFIASQTDALRIRAQAEEQHQLESGYTGHVRDSTATVDSDKVKILEEISDSGGEDHVDATIQTLLRSGLVTPALRIAYERGVDIAGVGIVRLKFLWLASHAWTKHMYFCLVRIDDTSIATSERLIEAFRCIVLLSCGLWWSQKFYRSADAKDRRAVSVVALWKIIGIPFLFARVVWLVARQSGWHSFVNFLRPEFHFWAFPILCCVVAVVCSYDIGQISSVPLVGVPVAQFLVSSQIRRTRYPSSLNRARTRRSTEVSIECEALRSIR